MSAWAWMLAAVAAVVIVAFVVTTWLLTIASGAKVGTDRANSRLDAVRTGLAAGAGAGAAVGLMLAFRRQHHQEIATDLTDRDATERRITELYTKAVEQLGSDKAPVRLGGLYALERLAQDNPAQRQTIVNVICAYLRMPFAPAAPAGKPEPEAAAAPEAPAAEADTGAIAPGDTWHQERQVRLTAQRVLADHLRDERARDQRSTDPPSPRFWNNIRLDLTGATLIDFGLHDAVVSDARFGSATFTGRAWFHGATFIGAVWFDNATFSGDAEFREAAFTGNAEFDQANFTGDADFNRATFSHAAVFTRTAFRGEAYFNQVTFGGRAVFDVANFSGGAWFNPATFSGDAYFDGATFSGDAGFSTATFSGYVGFGKVTFGDAAAFGGASFSRTAKFNRATFSGTAWFDEITVGSGVRNLSFNQSRILSPDVAHVWPTGWCLGPDGSGGYTVVREEDDSRL